MIDSRSRFASPLAKALYPLAWIVVLTMTTFAGHQSLFSTHAEYDDEGYVMMSLANFMQGEELYDATYSQYGPGFFHVTATIHRFTGLPITHTAIRFKTLVIWTLLAGLAAAIVFRLARTENCDSPGPQKTSRWFALAAFVVAFFHLDKMPLEPGHPQEVCALFVMLAAFVGTYELPRLGQYCSNEIEKGQPKATLPFARSRANPGRVARYERGGQINAPSYPPRRLGSDPPASGRVEDDAPIPAKAGTTNGTNRRLGILTLLGVLCGLAITCKLNVGIFLALAVGLAVITAIENDWLRRSLLAVSVTFGWVIGFALYKPYLTEWSAIQFPILCLSSMSLISASVWSRSNPGETTTSVAGRRTWTSIAGAANLLPLATVVGTSLLSAATVLAITNWSGTTWSGLKYGLIGQHAGFAGGFFHPVNVKNFAMPLTLASLAGYAFGKRPKFRWAAFAIAGLTLLAVAITHVSESNLHVTHGLNPRGAHGLLISAGLAVLWVMCSARSPARPGRMMLGLIASIQPLIAFPVSGSQVAFGTLPLLACCFVLVADGWHALAIAADALGQKQKNIARGQWAFYLSSATLVLLATVLLNRSVCNYRYRESREPLGLHGAEDIRLDPEFVEKQRWLVDQIQSNADTFVFTQHTRNSVYFWANVTPPNAINATFWPFMLNDDEQSSVVKSLADYERVAIINEPHYESVPGGPLVAELKMRRDNKSAMASNGKTQVWVIE